MNYNPMKPWWTVQFSCLVLAVALGFYADHIDSRTDYLIEQNEKIVNQLEYKTVLDRQIVEIASSKLEDAEPSALEQNLNTGVKANNATHHERVTEIESMQSKVNNHEQEIKRLKKSERLIQILRWSALVAVLLSHLRIERYNKYTTAMHESILRSSSV